MPSAQQQQQPPATTPISLLSYNINLLPFGRQHIPSHANKDERMSQFISIVGNNNNNNSNKNSSSLHHQQKNRSSTDNNNNNANSNNHNYDILALQEVYSSPFLPSFAVPSLCRQTRLIEQFRGRGYQYHAACEQPSVFSMLSKRTFTDSGLVIVSKYPIEHVASVAFAPPPPLDTLRRHLQQQQKQQQQSRRLRRQQHQQKLNQKQQMNVVEEFSDDEDENDVAEMNAKDISSSTNFATSTVESAGQPGCLFAAIRIPEPREDNNNNNNNENTTNTTPTPANLSNGSLLLVFNVHLSLCNRHEYQLLQYEADTVPLSAELIHSDNDDDLSIIRSSKKKQGAASSADAKKKNQQNAHQNKNNKNSISKANRPSTNRSFSYYSDTPHDNHSSSANKDDRDFGLTPTQRNQVTELRHFIEGILQQFPTGTPFVICGDFNVNALCQVEPVGTSIRQSRAYLELKSMLAPLLSTASSMNNNSNSHQEPSTHGSLDSSSNNNNLASPILAEALVDSLGHHPATRPVSAATQVADSPFSSYVGGVGRAKTQLRQNSSFALSAASAGATLSGNGNSLLDITPSSSRNIFPGGGSLMMLRSQEMRHDYIFFSGSGVSNSISLSKQKSCRIERFAMPEGSFPFRFLSDHFALVANFDISKNLMVKTNTSSASALSNRSKSSSSVKETTTKDNSNSEQENNKSSALATVSSIFILSPTTISILQSFPSLIAAIFLPKDIRYQRSGARLPIGAFEVLILALMFVSLPFWLIVGSVLIVALAIAAFFSIIQKKAITTAATTADVSQAASSHHQFYFDSATIDESTIQGVAPIKLNSTENTSNLLLLEQSNKKTSSSSSSSSTPTVAEMWKTAVINCGWLPCLGPSLFLSHCYSHGWLDQPFAHDDTSASEVITDFHHSFLTYSEVDRLALSFANGMLALCASLPEIETMQTIAAPSLSNTQKGPTGGFNNTTNSAASLPQLPSIQTSYRVGVLMQSSPTSILIDLAFLVYGHVRIDDIHELPNTAPLISVPLVGEAKALRTELDDAGCNVAISTVSQVKSILTCHARHLHTVIVVPDEPFYFLQQSSAGFNPKYHQNNHDNNGNRKSTSNQEQFQNLFGEDNDDDENDNEKGKRKNGSSSSSSKNEPFNQEINNPVLAGAANSLAARDVTSIPSSLELLATENSIQLVSIGELLHNGCILTREGRFERRSDEDNNNESSNINNDDDDNDGNPPNLNAAPSVSPLEVNHRIPHEDALATVMLDCRSTEGTYVSASSPFNKMKKSSILNDFEDEPPTAAAVYGRLLRLSHKNVSRFITQMSETGVIPSPSWLTANSSAENNNNCSTTKSSSSEILKPQKITTISPTRTHHNNLRSNAPSSSAASSQNSSHQSRILFQDVHHSYFERWSALCSLLSGHTTIVTRTNVMNPSNVNSSPASPSANSSSASSSTSESEDMNSMLTARCFHGACIALKPNVAFTTLLPLISSREIYDKIVSAGFSKHGLLQNFWSFAFRNMVRFRDQLGERDFDSSFIYKVFFRWITTTFFGTRIQRVIVASDEAVPYRVRHLLQLLLPFSLPNTGGLKNHQFLTVSFAPNIGIVHVNGTPPPRTLIRVSDFSLSAPTSPTPVAGVSTLSTSSSALHQNATTSLSGEIDLSGPAILGIDKDGSGYASSGLIGEWHQRQNKRQHNNSSKNNNTQKSSDENESSSYRWTLQVLCTGDALVRPGTISSLYKLIQTNKKINQANLEDEDAFHVKILFSSLKELMITSNSNNIGQGVDSLASSSLVPFVSAASLERAYIHECSFIVNDMFIWAHDGFPLVAVVVPNRPVLVELLISRLIQLRNKILKQRQQQRKQQQEDMNNGGGNEVDQQDAADDDDQAFSSNPTDDEFLRINDDNQLIAAVHNDPSVLFRSDIAKEIVVRACQVAFSNAGLSHEILAVHLHPHHFGVHSDFARANGSRRRSRMVEYFLEEIERMYISAIRQFQARFREEKKRTTMMTSNSRSGSNDNSSFTSAAAGISPSLLASEHNNGDSSSPSSLRLDSQISFSDSLVVTSTKNLSPSTEMNSKNLVSSPKNNKIDEKPPIRPVAPFAVDIGGTCAKVVFFLPGDADTRGLIPSYCTVEKNDAATEALSAAVDAKAIQEMMNESAVLRYGRQQANSSKKSPSSHHRSANSNTNNNKKQRLTPISASSSIASSSSVSFRLICMKLSTSMMSRFIQHLAAAPVLAVPMSNSSGSTLFSQSHVSNNNDETSQKHHRHHQRTVSSHTNNTTSSSSTSGVFQPSIDARRGNNKSNSNNNNNTSTSSPTSNLMSPYVLPSLATSLSNASSKLAFMFTRESLQHVPATGGGAFRFQGAARSQLGMRLEPVKEMESLVRGLNILLDRCPDLAVFSYDTRTHTQAGHKLMMHSRKKVGTGAASTTSAASGSASATNQSTTNSPVPNPASGEQSDETSGSSNSSSPYPFLLVNVGSGVSIVKLGAGDGSFVRVGGSPVGGATFWGLARALTNINSWEDLREITRVDGPGDHTKVDLLVGDIYGYNATALPAGLTVDTLASSCGKMASAVGNNNNNSSTTNRNAASGNTNNNTLPNGHNKSASSRSLQNMGSVGDHGMMMKSNSGIDGISDDGLVTGQGQNGAQRNTQRLDDDTTELLDWTQEVIHMATPKSTSSPNLNNNHTSNNNTNNHDNHSGSPSTNAHHNKDSSNSDLEGSNQNNMGRHEASSSQMHSPASNNNSNFPGFSSRNQNQNQNQAHHQQQQQLSSVDVIRSLLMMVATNITQIAFLYAKQENVKNILFTGGFVRGNALVWNQMTRALHYWSGGQMTAHFLKNDGYVGVLGALLNDHQSLVVTTKQQEQQATDQQKKEEKKTKQEVDDGDDNEVEEKKDSSGSDETTLEIEKVAEDEDEK